MPLTSELGVWRYARANGYTIVTKDSDFTDISGLRGPPPKVIWLRLGNCTTTDVEQAVRRAQPAIADFAADPAAGLLELL